MGAIDLLWHVGNLFAVPVLFALLAATGAKVIWRRALAAMAWRRLAALLVAVAMAVTLTGVAAFGRDGRMATYAMMVVAAAVVLGWAIWRRRP